MHKVIASVTLLSKYYIYWEGIKGNLEKNVEH